MVFCPLTDKHSQHFLLAVMQLLFQKIFLLCRLTRFAGRVGWDCVSGYPLD